MTRFLTAVVATFFLLTAVAHAERVQIYDYSVNDILNDIKKISEYMKNDKKYANVDFTIRGTHYYTGTDGFRYCESHFGDSDKNRLIFRVNNNGAVSSAWIVVRAHTLAGEFDENSATNGGVLSGIIFDVIGMSDDESYKLMDEFLAWNLANAKKLEQDRLNEIEKTKTFSVWCAKARRYIDLEATINLSNESLDLFIYAHT